MAYTTIDNPELYFQVKTYTGNGSTNAITLDGDEDMQPNMIWFKCRSATEHHGVFDNVRGVTKVIYPNLTNTEDTVSDSLSSFDSNGFTLGADTGSGGAFNGNTKTMVAWCWKAGGSASSNSNGSITSSVSANTTAGFSIVAYTGNETAGATVGHGLGAVPQTYWVKSRSVGDGWRVYHHKVSSDPETDYLVLNNDNANADSHGYWDDTAPTSSVFSLGPAGEVNTNSSTNIAYCFTEIKGYSKFGSYVANGNSDNAFVYTGFRPTFLLTKLSSTSGGGWEIVDSKRDGYNGENNRLYPNDTAAEGTGNDYDLLSNGFKVRQSGGSQQSGRTNIYMAFAESPFVNSNGVPNNAR